MADRDGLYLEVAASGVKVFRIKYRFDGREPNVKVGTCPE